MTAAYVVLLVVGILLVQAIIWIPIIVWMRRKSARLSASLRDELAASGERVSRGPESALYRGASAGYSGVRGNGVAALTDRRLVFRKLVGEGVELPVAEIVDVREDKRFLHQYRSGRFHLILRTRAGAEVGFMFGDHPGWMAAVREVLARRPS